MSFFQRRHFKRICEIAAKMDLTDNQLDILINHLHRTNYAFNEYKFRNYYSSLRGV